MEKIWLKSYPEGIPAEVDVNVYSSIVDVFEQSVKKFADKPSFTNFGTTLTYREMDNATRDLAAFLQQRLGLKKGDRVAVMMPNLLQDAISIFAILRAGLTVVNVNPLYKPRELQHQLKDSGANTIIILENFGHVLQEVVADTDVQNVIVTRMGDCLRFPKSVIVNAVIKYIKKMVPKYKLQGAIPFKNALSEGAGLSLNKPELGHDDIAFLQYTGGTTGVAKGAILTHGNIVANIVQVHAWIQKVILEGVETVITALPLYHIFSLTANCLIFMRMGALNYLITNPRDLKNFVKEIKDIHFTVMTGVNTLFNALLHTPEFADVDFSRFKFSLGGGMAVQKAVAEKWKQVTGCTLIEAYGLTETSPGACINPVQLEEYNGMIGLPIPSTEVTIRDDDNKELAIGETGEICIRGPQVTHGYWNQPEETARALDQEGWFHSGDIGLMDENGYIKIVDRKKDMILVSGFNVYPNEIEDVLVMHPNIVEVGAIGVPDDKSTEVVKVVVVKNDPNLTEEDVRSFAKERLTGYKVPKYVEFRDELPKTNVGKILRRALREPLA
ncbi:MAG: AMP-binding protein [Acidiferrobacterales bacterium]|nr:AMP-binding protein [Acidiferrobacterales bacterium]